MKPSQDSINAVNAYLQSNGINATIMSPAGDWLGFSIPVNQANEMFDANFSVFKHTASGKDQIRTLAYSIPASLSSHIDHVHPTTKYVQRNMYLASLQVLKCNLIALSPEALVFLCSSRPSKPMELRPLAGLFLPVAIRLSLPRACRISTVFPQRWPPNRTTHSPSPDL